MTRRIEKPEWTVGGGYEVGGNMDKLRVSWARDIVLPSDRGGGASSIKDKAAPLAETKLANEDWGQTVVVNGDGRKKSSRWKSIWLGASSVADQRHHHLGPSPYCLFHSNAMAGDHPTTEPMSKAEAAKWHGGGHGGKIPCAKYLAVHTAPSNQLTRYKIAIRNTSGRHRVAGTRNRRTGR